MTGQGGRPDAGERNDASRSDANSNEAALRARHLVVIPAGGTGSRLGAPIPKQYLQLGQATVIEHTVAAFLAQPWIDHIAVVVQPSDPWAHQLDGLRDPRVLLLRNAGGTRRDTVLAGLSMLSRGGLARNGDWVYVHDAVRPGIDHDSLVRLATQLQDEVCGALLCLPVTDTVKRTDPVSSWPTAGINRSGGTVDRSRLWLAQTPQVFRVAALRRALENHPHVTDEAAAIEAEGGRPRLVPGSRRNLKLTTVDDLVFLRVMLSQTMQGEASLSGQR